MPLPVGPEWDIVDWVATSVTDVASGMAAQIGSYASASRPDHVLVAGDGIRIFSDDGVISDYRLAIAVPQSFTFYLEGVLVPPESVVDGSNMLALGVQSRQGNDGLLFFEAHSRQAYAQFGQSFSPVPLGALYESIDAGVPVSIRMVVNGRTRLMDVYITRLDSVQETGEVLRATVPVLGAPSSEFDALSLYVRGAPSSIVVTALGLSSSLLSPKVRPVAVVSADEVAGVGDPVSVDGLSSYDLSSSPLSYAWRIVRQPENSDIVLSGMVRASAVVSGLTFTSRKSGALGNGDVIRFTNGGSTLSVHVERVDGHDRIVISPVVSGGVVRSTQRDLVLAFTSTVSESYNAEAASLVSVDPQDEWAALPAGLEVTLSGGADSAHPSVTFTPSQKGLYELELVVTNAHGISSQPSRVVVRAEDVAVSLGSVPDTSYIWNYVGDVWRRLVRNRGVVETFWSALLQKVSDELLQILQAQDELSLKTFPSRLMRRWVSFAVREELPASAVSVRPTRSARFVPCVSEPANASVRNTRTILSADPEFPRLSVGDHVTWVSDGKPSGEVATVTRVFSRTYTSSVSLLPGVRTVRHQDGTVLDILPLFGVGTDATQTFVVLRPHDKQLNRYDKLTSAGTEIVVLGASDSTPAYFVDRDIEFLQVVDRGIGLSLVDRNDYSSYTEPDPRAHEGRVEFGSLDLPDSGDLLLYAGGVLTKVESSTSSTIRFARSEGLRKCRAWVDLTPNAAFLFAREAGPSGNGITLYTVVGSDFGVRVVPNSRSIEVSIRPSGNTYLWELQRALSDPLYSGYCPEAAALVTIVSDEPYNDPLKTIAHVPRTVFTLQGGVDPGYLDWEVLRYVSSLEVKVGTDIVFDAPRSSPSVYAGDIVEFETSRIPISWATVLAQGVSVLIVDNDQIPAGAVAAWVVHTRTFGSATSDILAVPRLQSVIKAPADDEVFTEGTHYNCVDGRVVFVEPPAFVKDPLSAPSRLWGEVAFVDNSRTLESNFGILVGLPREAFTQAGLDIEYLSAVRGLFFIAYHGPAFSNIRIGSQIFANLAFAEEAGVIEDIQPLFDVERGLGRILIRSSEEPTRIRTYYYPSSKSIEVNPDTGVPFAVGDNVRQFQPLCTGVRVSDYISDPTWFHGHIYEVEKYHAFSVLVDSDVSTPQAVSLASVFVKAAKPAYTELVFGIRHPVTEDLEVTDSTTYELRSRLRDDRYTVEDGPYFDGIPPGCIQDAPPAFKSGYEHRFDDVDGAGSTYDGRIKRVQQFDMRPGVNPPPSQLLRPAGVRELYDVTPVNDFDLVSGKDYRQKVYLDRMLRYGPEDIPYAVRALYFETNGGPYLARFPHHLFAGNGDLSVTGGRIYLVDADVDFVELGVKKWFLVTFPETGRYAHVVDDIDPADPHKLVLSGNALPGTSVLYVIHRRERVDRICNVVYNGGNTYTIVDTNSFFNHQCEIRVGYTVVLNPGTNNEEEGVITVIPDSDSLEVESVGGMTVGENIPYRVFPPLLLPSRDAMDYIRGVGVGPGMYSSFDTIFIFDAIEYPRV